MTTQELFQRLALALAIGLLIGVERGWQEREGKPGSRAAGIRTYALIGLLGGIWGLIAKSVGASVLGFAALAFAATFGFFEWRETTAAGSVSATGLVAGLLAFALGAYAVMGDMLAAGSVAVAATAILAERRLLHGFLEKLKWVELRAALMLLVMTVVLLPVLPDRTIDPWGAINPYQLWLLTILTAAISYGGYVAVRIAGGRKGLLYGGATGGLVSSTTVTWTFARLAKQQPLAQKELSAGITASWAMSLLRMSLLATILAPALAFHLAAPVAGAIAVTSLATAYFYRGSVMAGEESPLTLEDPFDLRAILRFCAMLAVVLLAAKLLSSAFGPGGVISLAAISGFADVDPITLSMAKLSRDSGVVGYAALAILTAAGTNLVAKCALAVFFGGLRFALPLIATAAVAALTAGAILIGY